MWHGPTAQQKSVAWPHCPPSPPPPLPVAATPVVMNHGKSVNISAIFFKTEEDIKCPKRLAPDTYKTLETIFNSKHISEEITLRTFTTYTQSIFLYNSSHLTLCLILLFLLVLASVQWIGIMLISKTSDDIVVQNPIK